MKSSNDLTLSEIVKRNPDTVTIFEKFHLDYCCNGSASLAEACLQNDVDLDSLQQQLNNVSPNTDSIHNTIINCKDVNQIIDHIVLNHHTYVKTQIPIIINHISKVVAQHGKEYPYLETVSQFFAELATELEQHLLKEEQVLFPHLMYLANFKAEYGHVFSKAEFVKRPIQMMELEHERAGALMDKLRKLTNNYLLPQSACATFALLFQELDAFEKDLHQHVFLENNILFPLGIELEACLLSQK